MPPSFSRYIRSVSEAADHIGSYFKPPFKFAVLTGTGSGDSLSSLQADGTMDYRDIPNFPASTVQSHYGRLSAGKINGHPILFFQGRFHLYEGYTAQQVSFPIRVMQALGVEVLIMTNAAGGLNPLFSAGDIMIIEDHINLTGANPLAGPNHDAWGVRFPEMTHAYHWRLQELAQSASRHVEAAVQKGIYAGLLGPSLETPSEMRFLNRVGADAVGFSTVMETIAAVHAGMQVLALSVITNMCLPDAPTPSSVAEIVAMANRAAPHLETIMTHVIDRGGV